MYLTRNIDISYQIILCFGKIKFADIRKKYCSVNWYTRPRLLGVAFVMAENNKNKMFLSAHLCTIFIGRSGTGGKLLVGIELAAGQVGGGCLLKTPIHTLVHNVVRMVRLPDINLVEGLADGLGPHR